MRDLQQRFQELDRLDVPDMRADIEQRAAEPSTPLVPTPVAVVWWRGPLVAVATAAAVILVVAAAVVLWRGVPRDVVGTHAELLTLTSHPEGVAAVAWSPDGTHLATASRAIEGSDGIAKVWDADTGDELLSFPLGDTETMRVEMVYSPNGTRLAFGGPANAIYDSASGEELLDKLSRALAYSPDGTRLTVGGGWGYAAVIDAATGDEQLNLGDCPSPYSWVWAAAWSPDGARLATTCRTTVKVWDAATGEELLAITSDFMTTEVSARVTDVAWSPDGTRIATASRDIDASIGWMVEVWDAGTGNNQLRLTGRTGGVWVVTWSPDGTQLATAGDDGSATIWDANSGNTLAILTGHTAAVADVAWSPDGTRLATASDDGTIKIWRVD